MDAEENNEQDPVSDFGYINEEKAKYSESKHIVFRIVKVELTNKITILCYDF